jgi:hemolysin activation/secretion protein
VVGGFSSLRRDSRGAWVLGATVTLSPGHFNSRNTSDAFQGYPSRKAFPIGRQGSNARYLYGNVSLQRLVTLPREWQLVSRATLQASSANLLGSEQLSIGGSSTVRGFDERIMTGDEGFVFSNDVQTPGMRTQLPFLPKTQPPLETHFTVFYDAGQVRSAHVNVNDAKQYPLASSGVGLRASLGVNFYLTADYGWQITRLPARYSMGRNRGHVKVVLAY